MNLKGGQVINHIGHQVRYDYDLSVWGGAGNINWMSTVSMIGRTWTSSRWCKIFPTGRCVQHLSWRCLVLYVESQLQDAPYLVTANALTNVSWNGSDYQMLVDNPIEGNQVLYYPINVLDRDPGVIYDPPIFLATEIDRPSFIS